MPLLMTIVAVLLVLGTGVPSAAGAGPVGETTINLRTCVDAGDGACLTAGDLAIDGVTVCLRRSGGPERCGATEDGELWFDSLPQGSYNARVVPPPELVLAGATCTTFPNLPYEPCRAAGSAVRLVVRGDVTAVYVGFLFHGSSTPGGAVGDLLVAA